MQTIIANQAQPPPDRRERGYHLPYFSVYEERGPTNGDQQEPQGDRSNPHPKHPDDREEHWYNEEGVHGIQRGERHIHTRALRLDFPRFDGTNPSGWSYKVNQFFDYYQTPLYQRIQMASFHMEGEALVWFQDADEARQFPSWIPSSKLCLFALVQPMMIQWNPW